MLQVNDMSLTDTASVSGAYAWQPPIAGLAAVAFQTTHTRTTRTLPVLIASI